MEFMIEFPLSGQFSLQTHITQRIIRWNQEIHEQCLYSKDDVNSFEDENL